MPKPKSPAKTGALTAIDIQIEGDRLHLEYVYVDDAHASLLADNPKLHDLQKIFDSIVENGFRDPPTWDSNLNGSRGGIVEGNGRISALKWGQDQGRQPPRGIFALKEGGWILPVLFGLDARSETAARRYAIDHNNLVMAGGNFTAVDMSRMWEQGAYSGYLEDLAKQDSLPLTVDGDDLDLLLSLLDGAFEASSDEQTTEHSQLEQEQSEIFDGSEVDSELEWIKIKGKKMPLSQEEAQMLVDRFELYCQQMGTNYGFFGSLIQ